MPHGTTNSPIKVLVVDDSALIRRIISDAVINEPDMELVGTASSGEGAIQQTLKLKPDCITLDLRMPGMDGLAALPKILEARSTPVIVVSACTTREADITFDALQLGAIDYVTKPDLTSRSPGCWLDELVAKIRNAAGIDVHQVMRIRQTKAKYRKPISSKPTVPPYTNNELQLVQRNLIAIGISTGGPPVLNRLFESLQPPLPPIAIVQHMPRNFTHAFAKRLDSVSAISVKEAESGDLLQPNCAFVAPGGMHMEVKTVGGQRRLSVWAGDPVSGHCPSVDVLFQSAAEVYGKRCVGVIMTGMGRDGADGCGEIRARNGYVLGQDQATSVVYGMNKVAFVSGHVDRQFDISDLPALLMAKNGEKKLPGFGTLQANV